MREILVYSRWYAKCNIKRKENIWENFIVVIIYKNKNGNIAMVEFLLWNISWSNYNIIKKISYPWIALDNKIWIPAQSLLSTKWCCFLHKLSINKVTFITFVFEIQLFLVLSSRNLQQTQATNENHRYDIYWYCNTLLLQVFRIKSDSSQTSNSHRYPIKDIVEANPFKRQWYQFLI